MGEVAYADFVTAMMALFIVLWLMSADKEVQQAVSAYFNNPSGPGKQTGTAAAGLGNAIEIPKDDMKKLAEKIQQALMTVRISACSRITWRSHDSRRTDCGLNYWRQMRACFSNRGGRFPPKAVGSC